MKNPAIRLLAAAATAAILLLTIAPAARAHDPIFVADDQTSPDTGPFMPDGSISWALYGVVLEPGDTRGFEFDLRDGDEVFVSLLIPNLSPEIDLADDELPIIELEAPDGTVTTIAPEVRDVFDEPFSNTSYVTLAEFRESAQAGRYRGLIIGNAPSRFSVAIGETEIFFTDTERAGERPTNFAEISVPLTAWYTTPPGGVPDDAALAEGEAQIDLEMIEDAMATGEADAPEGSLDEAPGETSDDANESALDEPALDEPAEVEERATTDEAAEDVSVEPEPESGESESASAIAQASDDGGSATWVAPVAVGVVAALGLVGFARRRRSEA